MDNPRTPVSEDLRIKMQGGENAPKGFQGGITEEESWKICPYHSSHRYLRPFDHLTKCRARYLQECREKGQKEEDVDIVVCKYDWQHHVPRADVELHEKECSNKGIINRYLRDYRIRLAYKLLLTPDPEDNIYEDPGRCPLCRGTTTTPKKVTPGAPRRGRVSDVDATFSFSSSQPPPSTDSDSETTVVQSAGPSSSCRASSSFGSRLPSSIEGSVIVSEPEPSSSRGLRRGRGRGRLPGLQSGNEASSEASSSSFEPGQLSRPLTGRPSDRFPSGNNLGPLEPSSLFRGGVSNSPAREIAFPPGLVNNNTRPSLMSSLSRSMDHHHHHLATTISYSDSSHYSCAARKVVPKIRNKKPTAEELEMMSEKEKSSKYSEDF